MKIGRKFLEIVGALTSTFVGIGVPVLLVVLLITSSIRFNARVDKCLDSGGSFDYQACACDYDVSHPYQKGTSVQITRNKLLLSPLYGWDNLCTALL